MFDGILQYPLVKQLIVTNANIVKQICQIRTSHVKCSQKKTWLRLWGLENRYKNEYLPLHDFHINQDDMHQDPNYQEMVPSYHYKTVQYRKTQAHSKSYQPQYKKSEDDHLPQSNHMQTVKNEKKKTHIIDNLVQSRPKRAT